MKDSILQYLPKIQLLALVGETESLKKAAIQSSMSNSALSQNIAVLEAYFGKTLVLRRKDGVSLSPDGLELVTSTRPYLEELLKLDRRTDPDPTATSRLSIGAYDSIAITVFPRILPQLRRRVPKLRLNIQMGRTHTLLAAVRAGELDLALIVEPDDPPSGYELETLSTERLGMYVSARHEISERGSDAIHDFGIATLSPSPTGYPLYYQKFMSALGATTVVVTTDSFEAVRNLVLSGSVVGLLPQRVAQRYPDELREITPAELPTNERGEHRFGMACRRNIDPSLRQFAFDEIRRAFS